MIADDAGDAGQKVAIDMPRKLVIRGRHLALKRARASLIQNAVRYGGSAAVSAREGATEIVIDVADNGPGIPGEQLDAVFSPFFRLEDSRSRSTGGYGLGLTVARTIASSHGGDVTLSNRAEGGCRQHCAFQCAVRQGHRRKTGSDYLAQSRLGTSAKSRAVGRMGT